MDDQYRVPDYGSSPDDQVAQGSPLPPPPMPPVAPTPQPPTYSPPPPPPSARPGARLEPSSSAPQYAPTGPMSGYPSSGPLQPGQQGYYQPSGPLPPQPQPQPQPQQWQTGPMGGAHPSVPLQPGQGYYPPSGPLPQQGYYPPSGPLPQGYYPQSGPLPQQGYYPQSGPLPPQQPAYYQPMQQPMIMVPPVVVQSDNGTLAIILEVVAGLFGLYGIGWLIAGFHDTGVKVLVGGLIWWLVAILISVFTLGFGLVCIWPVDLIIMIVSVVNLSSRLKQRQMGMMS